MPVSSLVESLRAEGTTRFFPVGHVLVEVNQYIKNVPVVLSGSIRVSQVDQEGREILLYYIQPGESCIMSFLGAFCDNTSKIRAVVEEEADVLLLPVAKAVALTRENGAWLEFIFRLYNRRYEELLQVVHAVLTQKMEQRLWEHLRTKARVLHVRELSVTHQQLADELGTAREVVSRVLKQWEREGKVALGRHRISLLAS